MITVTGLQQDMARAEKARRERRDPARQDREPVTGAHDAARAADASARAADRDAVPSVSEQWAGLSGPERSRLEQAGVVWDRDAGIMRDSETGTQLSVGEVRALLERQAVRKAGILGLEAERGPGRSMQPGQIKPEDFQRGPLGSGHAAVSPQHGAPNTSPLPPVGRGILTPVELPSVPGLAGHNGPIVQAMAAHQARAVPSRPPARGQ